MKEILHYFPNLSQEQVQQFAKLKDLYEEWNQQINVISRKDTANFYERHVLHSLGIAKIIRFQKASEIRVPLTFYSKKPNKTQSFTLASSKINLNSCVKLKG